MRMVRTSNLLETENRLFKNIRTGTLYFWSWIEFIRDFDAFTQKKYENLFINETFLTKPKKDRIREVKLFKLQHQFKNDWETSQQLDHKAIMNYLSNIAAVNANFIKDQEILLEETIELDILPEPKYDEEILRPLEVIQYHTRNKVSNEICYVKDDNILQKWRASNDEESLELQVINYIKNLKEWKAFAASAIELSTHQLKKTKFYTGSTKYLINGIIAIEHENKKWKPAFFGYYETGATVVFFINENKAQVIVRFKTDYISKKKVRYLKKK